MVVGWVKIEVERRMLEELEGFDKSPAAKVANAAAALQKLRSGDGLCWRDYVSESASNIPISTTT